MEFPSGQLYFMASRVAARKKELLKWFLLVIIGDHFLWSLMNDAFLVLLRCDLFTTMGTGRARMKTPMRAHRPPISWTYVFLHFSIFAFLYFCISVFQCSLQFLCISIFVSTGGKSFDQLKLIKHMNFVLLSGKTRGKLSCIMFKGALVLGLAY